MHEELTMKKYLFLLLFPCLAYSMQLSEQEKSDLLQAQSFLQRLEIAQCIHGWGNKLNILIANGAISDLKTSNGTDWSPLHLLAYGGDPLLIPVLKKLGADINAIHPGTSWTPIEKALRVGNKEMIIAFINNGATIPAHFKPKLAESNCPKEA